MLREGCKAAAKEYQAEAKHGLASSQSKFLRFQPAYV